MDRHLLGQTCALLAAVNWAFALILFKRSGETIPPIALNLFKNTLGLILFALTLVVTGDGLAALREQSTSDIAWLLFSGFLGIAVADTLVFYGLNLIGVGLTSIVDCLYSPFIVGFAWLLLGERLTPYHYLGGAFIVMGVFVSSRHAPPPNRTRTELVVGMGLIAAALASMAFGIVIVKPVLERFPLVWTATLRLLAGTVPLAVFALISSDRSRHWSAFRPAPVWKSSLPASVLGTYAALLLWIAGFKYTHATVSAILNQTSVIFALVLATLILKEPFTRRKFAAVTLATVGVALVQLYHFLPGSAPDDEASRPRVQASVKAECGMPSTVPYHPSALRGVGSAAYPA
jgi:drug/metabolite transporter (DMT)-like permease